MCTRTTAIALCPPPAGRPRSFAYAATRTSTPPLQLAGRLRDHGRPRPTPRSLLPNGYGVYGATERHRAPPSDTERVGEANARPAEPEGPQERYELAFPAGSDGDQELVEVTRTSRTGPGGHPVHEDATGIVRAEISDRAEVRLLATGGQQESIRGIVARPPA